MSTKYKIAEQVPSSTLYKRLKELSKAVTKGEKAILREFVMRVPAEVDYDADLVLSAAAERISRLEIELIEKAEQENELKIEAGRLKCIISDLQGSRAGDTCGMCNWLERGDCHEQKEKLRKEVQYLDGKILAATKCDSRAVQYLLEEAKERTHFSKP